MHSDARTRIIRRTCYAIGNSLTNDSRVGSVLQSFAQSSGAFLQSDYHIRGASSLARIVEVPNDFLSVSPSQWPLALPSGYGCMQVQPYFGSPISTIGAEVTSIQTFFNVWMRQAPQCIFIYTGWPPTVFASNYQNYWTGSIVDAPSTQITLRRQTFEHIQDRLRAALPDIYVAIIPIGEVLYNVDIAARAGEIAGASTVADFYRDEGHLGNAGRYLAAATTIATLFRRLSTSDSVLDSFASRIGGLDMTASLRPVLESLAINTVQQYTRSRG